MNSALDRKTLVLNADFRPLQTYPLSLISGSTAVSAVFRDRATVVEVWPEVFRSPSIEIPVPKTIALRQYAPINSQPKFCRRSILLRDRYCCQYCGERFPSDQLSFDHVVPRSAGGLTVWENILSCCLRCNALKRDRAANWSGKKGAGLRPLKEPRAPTTAELLRAGLAFIDPAVKENWADWLYWSVELRA